jgi:hypothetical protein
LWSVRSAESLGTKKNPTTIALNDRTVQYKKKKKKKKKKERRKEERRVITDTNKRRKDVNDTNTCESSAGGVSLALEKKSPHVATPSASTQPTSMSDA